MGKIIAGVFVVFLMTVVGCKTTEPVLRGSKSPLDTPENHYAIGMKLIDKGELTNARKEFEHGISLNSKDSACYQGLALVQIEQGDLKEARETLKLAVKYGRSDANTYCVRGRLYDAEKQYKKAIANYRKAVRLAPQNTEAFYLLGKTYIKMYQFDRADEALTRALDLDPQFVKAKAERDNLARIKSTPLTPGASKTLSLSESITRAELASLIVAELKLGGKDEVLESDDGGEEVTGVVEEEEEWTAPAYAKKEIEQKVDIPDISNHWAEAQIRTVLTMGLMKRDSSGNFNPERIVTRGEFVRIMQNVIVAQSGDESLASKYLNEESPFKDVPSASYDFNPVMLAVEKGILLPGSKNTFGLNDKVTGVEAVQGLRKVKGQR